MRLNSPGILACALVAVFTIVGNAAAEDPTDPPTCPSEPFQGVLPGVPLGPWSTALHALNGEFEMKPCETLHVQLSGGYQIPPILGCMSGSPSNVSMKMTLFNASMQQLATINYLCEGGSCSQELPVPASAPGYPLPGTRGPGGLAKYVEVKANVFNWCAAAPVNYTLTVSKQPRPDYNIGGTNYLNATPTPLGVRQYGSVHPFETEGAGILGQYYKIQIPAGQQISLQGEARGTPWAATFSIALFDSNQQPIKTMVNMLAGQATTPFPTGGTNTFTNTGSTAAYYYLRVRSQYYVTQDFNFKVVAPGYTPPTLTLFLDADPLNPDLQKRFRVEDPQSDDQFFLPGTDFAGYDHGIPQKLALVAAYVDAEGEVVAPPYGVSQVNFSLDQTTAYQGRTMNVGDEGTPDYDLEGPPAVSFASDHTARITLWCRDYGGFTVARVTDRSQTPALELPWDSQRDGIPDIGWRAADIELVTPRPPDEDDDADPVSGPGIPSGDLLSAVQEYRGFTVLGSHRRTNPSRKDLFVQSSLPDFIGDAVMLPLAIHSLVGAEMPGDTRIINANYQNHASGPHGNLRPDTEIQRGLRVVDDGLNPNNNAVGITQGGVPFGPRTVQGNIKIFTDTIRLISPPNHDGTPDPPDVQKINQTLGHEFGHGVGMPDWRKDTSVTNPNSGCPDIPLDVNRELSVMVSCYFSNGTTQYELDKWQNIPHTYHALDLVLLRLRF